MRSLRSADFAGDQGTLNALLTAAFMARISSVASYLSAAPPLAIVAGQPRSATPGLYR